MARNKAIGVEYFPHDTNSSEKKTLFTLESMYGNDGYAFWFKLLEVLGQQETLSFCVRNEQDWLFLLAKTKVSEEKATNILDTLSKMGAIDRKLWEDEKIITSFEIQKMFVKLSSFISDKFILSKYNLVKGTVKIPFYKTNKNTRMYSINVKKWIKISKTVFKRDNYTCCYCGQIGGLLEIDHVIPFSKGGSDDLSNLVTSCRRCNRQKRDKSQIDFINWRAIYGS